MILIAIGANLSTEFGRSPKESCEWATRRLAEIVNVNLVSRSPWYLSEAIPPSGHPAYINGIVRLEGTPEPSWLLARLHEIEAESGRIRHQINDPRTLDLDLIDLNGVISAGPTPILPHPRAHLRAFVLLPLRDVAPEWVHPALGQTASDLLAGLPPQPIVPLARAHPIA